MEKFKDWGKWRKTSFIFVFFVFPSWLIFAGPYHPILVIAIFFLLYLFGKVMAWITDLLGIEGKNSTLDDDGD